MVVGRRAPWPKSGGGGMWWWGGVLGAAAGEGVNTQLPGDHHSCQIISGRVISYLILLPNYRIVFYLDSEPGVFKG